MFGLFDEPAVKIRKKLSRDIQRDYDLALAVLNKQWGGLVHDHSPAGEQLTHSMNIGCAMGMWVVHRQETGVHVVPENKFQWIVGYIERCFQRANPYMVMEMTDSLDIPRSSDE